MFHTITKIEDDDAVSYDQGIDKDVIFQDRWGIHAKLDNEEKPQTCFIFRKDLFSSHPAAKIFILNGLHGVVPTMFSISNRLLLVRRGAVPLVMDIFQRKKAFAMPLGDHLQELFLLRQNYVLSVHVEKEMKGFSLKLWDIALPREPQLQQSFNFPNQDIIKPKVASTKDCVWFTNDDKVSAFSYGAGRLVFHPFTTPAEALEKQTFFKIKLNDVTLVTAFQTENRLTGDK